MDATKLRLFAAVAGIVCGFGGMFALSVAGILALASVIGLTAACFTIAAILVAIAALMLYIFLLPYRKSSEEIDDLEKFILIENLLYLCPKKLMEEIDDLDKGFRMEK